MVEVLVRGRFVAVPQATADNLRDNVWSVALPRDEATTRLLRTTMDDKGLDDLVLSIAQIEAMQVLLSDINDETVVLTVLMP